MLDPGIWTSTSFLRLTARQRLLFIGLISNSDDEGKQSGDLRAIKARVFPSDTVSLAKIECDLDEIGKTNQMILRYEVDSEPYIKLPKWLIYQKIDRPSASQLPDPIDEPSTNFRRTIDDGSSLIEDKLREKNRIESQKLVQNLFNEFWKFYPKKQGKKDALSAFASLDPDDELFKIILTNIEGLKRTKQWIGDNGQFIPLPANYIRDERWRDEGVKLNKSGESWKN